MGKKDANKVQKPTHSFEQMVAEASLNRLKPFIEFQVQEAATQMKREHVQDLQGMYERLTALEKLVLEKTGTSDEEYSERVIDVQDMVHGLKQVSEACALGDTVRIEVSSKAKDQEEFQGSSRYMVQDLGSGRAIGKELEDKILGMTKGETRTVDFGVDGAMVAKITLNRVSRRT